MAVVIRARDALAVAILSALVVAPNFLAPISFYDGGLAGSAGTFMVHGAWPYRDFWWLYGPGAPVLSAVPSAIFGHSILVLRTLGLILLALDGVFAYAIARRWASHTTALLVALGGVAPAGLLMGLDLTAWSLALTLMLGALLFDRSAGRSATLAGAIVGLAFLVRLDVGAYGLIALVLPAGNRRRVLAGFLAVTLPVAAILCLSVPISDLVSQLIVYPLFGTRQFRAVPLATIDNGATLLALLPVAIVPKVAVVLSVARMIWRRSWAGVELPLTIFALLCQLQTLGRADIYHQGQASLPGFILLASLADVPRRRGSERPGSRPHLARGLAWGAVLAASLTGVAIGVLSFSRVERGPMPAAEVDLVAGIRTLRANTTADEPVFVGLTANRHTFINHMIAYYLADRRAGVRVAMYNPGITNTDPVQAEMASDLQHTNTRVLLLDATFANAFEPTNESRLPGSTVLDDYIASHYVPACAFGETKIYVSSDRAGTVTCVAPAPSETLIDILGGA